MVLVIENHKWMEENESGKTGVVAREVERGRRQCARWNEKVGGDDEREKIN